MNEANENPLNNKQHDQGYRTGYHHGFIAGRTQPDVSIEEVKEWRYSYENVCPPGSPMSGVSRNFKRPISEILEDLPFPVTFDEDENNKFNIPDN